MTNVHRILSARQVILSDRTTAPNYPAPRVFALLLLPISSTFADPAVIIFLYSYIFFVLILSRFVFIYIFPHHLLFFFFLMIRRPPRSPLFPSPTLFRSPPAPGQGCAGGASSCRPEQQPAGGGRRLGFPGSRLAPGRPRRRDLAAIPAHRCHSLVGDGEIGRAHVLTPVTRSSRIPSSS